MFDERLFTHGELDESGQLDDYKKSCGGYSWGGRECGHVCGLCESDYDCDFDVVINNGCLNGRLFILQA